MYRNRIGKTKKGRFYPAAVLLTALLLTACGQKTDEMKDSSIQAPPADAPTQESSEHMSEDTGPASEDSPTTDDETIPETITASDEDRKADDEKQPEAPKQDEAGDTAEQASPASVSGQVTLEGSIETIGSGVVTINKIFTETAEDGSQIAWSSNDDKTLLDIGYTDQTVFIIRSSTDSGITHTDTPGSAADLEKDRSIIAAGAWDGDIFRADEIVIYHFG